MKRILLLPIKSIIKNKGQTFSVVLSIVLSVALIISVSSLMYSSRQNRIQNDRDQYGDYHYHMLGNKRFAEKIRNDYSKDFTLTNVQTLDLKRTQKINDTFDLTYVFGDANGLKMSSYELIEGDYPTNNNHIAMDRYTLRALNANDKIGSKIDINEESFYLTGITSEPSEINSSKLTAFVSSNYEGDLGDTAILFLAFDESTNFYNQVNAFANNYQLDKEWLTSNGPLVSDVIDSNIQRIINTIRTTLQDKDANFTTLIMKLQSDFHLTSGLVTFILVVYAIFIVYSIFNISVLKRLRTYGILQTIGVNSNTIGMLLFLELLILFTISFPIGILLGIGIDILLFDTLGSLFSGKTSLIENVHKGNSLQDFSSSSMFNNRDKFYVDHNSILLVAILFILLFIFISWILKNKIQSKQVVELVNFDSTKKKEKIYSLKSKSLLSVLTNKFMFRRFSTLFAVVLSLSIGGVMILATNYIATNSKLNSELVMHSEDGLASDIKVDIDDGSFNSGITFNQLTSIRNLPKLKKASGYKYLLGETIFEKEKLKWKEYWPEIADNSDWKQTPEIVSRFNGIVSEKEDTYNVKTNIYGYDFNDFSKLDDFIIEGEVDPTLLQDENSVVLRTIVDSQNNTDGLNLHVGDKITLKTPKQYGNPDLLRFNSSEDNYEYKTFTIAALARKSIVTNKNYIGDRGLDIIMTNDMMSSLYNIDNFEVLTIDKEEKKNTEVVRQIDSILSGNSKVNIFDNTIGIQAKLAEFRRAEFFLYGIGALLLIVSLFHINNTMYHLIYSRRYVFAVLRAMGITEKDFLRMLLKEALKYTLLTCGTIFIIYRIILQRFIAEFLVRVNGYLNVLQPVNIFIPIVISIIIFSAFILSIGIPAKHVLNSNITAELKQ